MLIGPNGIITKAQEAKTKTEDANRKEELRIMIMDYIADIDTKDSFQTFLKRKEQEGEIEKAVQIPNPDGSDGRRDVVLKDGHYYMIIEDENGNYNIEELNTELGEIGEGLTLATPENFKESGNGTMSFNPGPEGESTLVFSDKINDEFCFDIQSGTVTIYIDNDMTLTNEHVEPRRSAINIEPNATLNLHISENVTLTVNSGFGNTGANTEEGMISEGGHGGYAGIRVPKTEKGEAVLNVFGGGTLIAIGGNAGSGGVPSGTYDGTGGGRRRRWRSRNRWKWRKRRKRIASI